MRSIFDYFRAYSWAQKLRLSVGIGLLVLGMSSQEIAIGMAGVVILGLARWSKEKKCPHCQGSCKS